MNNFNMMYGGGDSFWMAQHNWAWFLPAIGLVSIWTLFWKGKALWKAAHRKELYWFIALLVINTLGILEIVYLYVITKDRHSHHA